MNYFDVFGRKKPVIGMLHLKSDDKKGMLDRAIEEINIYLRCSIEALLVENYFGDEDDCETVLAWLHTDL